MKSRILLNTAAIFVASIPSVHAADYVKGYTNGSGSQLLVGNGGAGTVLFVDQAITGGGDMIADGGNPTWGWEIDGSANWNIGDKVEFTGIAMPIWANSAATDGTGNTQNATHRIRIYSCGANNSFDGTGTDAQIGEVDVFFTSAGAGVDKYRVNFDAPVEWASADSTSFYFYIQALDGLDGNAMRFKTGAPGASAAIKNRTNGAGQTIGGSTTTSLSVAGIVNQNDWFGDGNATADGIPPRRIGMEAPAPTPTAMLPFLTRLSTPSATP